MRRPFGIAALATFAALLVAGTPGAHPTVILPSPR